MRESNGRIQRTLDQCVDYIEREHSVASAWDLAVKDLGWTDTVASKYLHFLARSLGYDTNPPVPMDGKVIVQMAWPAFKRMIQQLRGSADLSVPGVWRDRSSWDAYNRYMTAILCWAGTAGWSSTQVENTIFAEYSTI